MNVVEVNLVRDKFRSNLFDCPRCKAAYVRKRSGDWASSSDLGCKHCRSREAVDGNPVGPFAREWNVVAAEPSIPTCCSQPMQPSTSPYRWDTGELIKGKLLVCRECGEYREAEAGTSGSSPEVVRLPGRVTLNGKPLPAVHSLTYSIGATAAHPAIPEHAIHSIGSGLVCCFTNVDLDAQQKSLVTGALADDAVTFFQTTIAIPPGGQRIDASGKLVPR